MYQASHPMTGGLQKQAIDLAHCHVLTSTTPESPPILRQLPHVSAWLDDIITLCRQPDAKSERAARWILDNHYQIRRTIRQITEDMPAGFYKLLPSLAAEGNHGLPRVLVLIKAMLKGSNLRPSLSGFVEFVSAYQTVQPLCEAELWAIPALARLVCLDILIATTSELFEPSEAPFAPIPDGVSRTPISATDSASVGTEPDPAERIAHSITALLILNGVDWHGFVDATSGLNALLGEDPANIYALMDRDTRSVYRKAVESMARHSAHSELEVASAVISRCQSQSQDNSRTRHVGFWLVDAGVDQMHRELMVRLPFRQRLYRTFRRQAGVLYAGALLAVMLGSLCLPVWYLYSQDASRLLFVVVLLLSLFPASIIAISLVHWIIPRLVDPRVLPALDARHGVPVGAETVIAIPVIIGSVAEIAPLIEQLEIRHLANPEPGLCFALLSDPIDANLAVLPADHAVEESLVTGIRRLNSRYPQTNGDRFVLLHRHREFNAVQDCWMAHERKRGKLEQFSTLLIEGWQDAFKRVEGDLSMLVRCHYMIVLDADTTLPPGSALQMICTLAHPLNRALLDPVSGRVCAGYTVLQPRIECLTRGESSSVLAQVFAGDSAIDIYSRAVSDVYQDLFGVGSYVGKGILDIRAFQASLEHRVPDNTILSHDLFEGLHGRVALASNIVLYEQFPQTWPEHAARQHRWIRGDWQLLPWIGRRVPVSPDREDDSVFSRLDRWKLQDNLRRSLLPVVMLCFFLGGWFFFPGQPWVWTVLAAGAFAPYLVDEAFASIAQLSRQHRPRGFVHRIKLLVSRWLISIAFLVSDALTAIDAVARTLWRVYVTRSNLLQWTPSAHMQNALSAGAGSFRTLRLMWPSPALAVAVSLALFWHDATALIPAAPVLLAWMSAPWLAARLGRPRRFRRDQLTAADEDFLRSSARRTWHYFNTWCSPEDNWLPPDNYQSVPGPILAHRTSPTNMGLYLTSALAACDLGYIGVREFSLRVRNLLDSVDRLTMRRGHLLNWYDTRTLAPLEPGYVSTVDSGNLAVCLIAVKQGCLDVQDTGVMGDATRQGLRDTLRVLREILQQADIGGLPQIARLADQLDTLISRLDGNAAYGELKNIIGTLWPELNALVAEALTQVDVEQAEMLSDARIWLERFDRHLRALLRDMDDLLPWHALAESAPPACADAARQVLERLPLEASWSTMAAAAELCCDQLRKARARVQGASEEAQWYWLMEETIERGTRQQAEMLMELDGLVTRSHVFAYAMDFSWLYNPVSKLFHIGYNVSSGMLDDNHYDLLASEARIASFFAIAKHDVPVEHWFQLGRPVIRQDGQPTAQSWNGSMFEYLMPPLFLPGKRDTLLGESESTAVSCQREYAKRHLVPWGVSESAFAVTDGEGNYQYRAFGTPALGIRRGLTDDLVVAPYASMLALAVWPGAAVQNLRVLASLGAMGRYGFIDAIDYTPGRTTGSRPYTLVQTWMAHHQGMSLVAMDNALNADCMARRVLREKSMQSMELLLQERIPWAAPIETAHKDELLPDVLNEPLPALPAPWVPSGPLLLPQLQLLGNGRLSARVSRRGGGGLFYRGLSLTRWHPDPADHARGYRIHVNDRTAGLGGWIGNMGIGQHSRVTFAQQRIEFTHHLDGVTLRLEVVIAPDENIDIRRVTITNGRARAVNLSLTSAAEVTLADVLDDERHPAFSKLFVGSREEPDQHGISFVRRPRQAEDHPPVLLHRVLMDESGVQFAGFETDRLRWLGRPADVDAPAGLKTVLAGATGWTLDPVMVLRVNLQLAPGETRQCAFVTLVGDSRASVLERSATLSLPRLDQLFADADDDAARELDRLSLSAAPMPVLQNLASLLIFPHAALRSVPPMEQRRPVAQAALWPFGISGDLPLLLLQLDDNAATDLLDLLLRAQALWRRRGLSIDLVVLRVSPASYEEPLRERILDTLQAADAYGWIGRQGGVHLLSRNNLSTEQVSVLEASAHVLLDTHRALRDRLDDVLVPIPRPPRFQPTGALQQLKVDRVQRPAGLLFDNGLGGFDPTTNEYVIHLEAGEATPAPWCNVLSNEQFGCIVSEAGLGFTWAQNSGEHRLTRWSNDPIADTPGEMLYLRDETTAAIWCVTPSPQDQGTAIQIRHGFGFTTWQRHSHGLEQELQVLVARHDPVKVVRLRLKNRSGQARRLTVTYYADWLLGALASQSRCHVSTAYDANLEAIIASNAWNPEFAGRVAFLCASRAPHSVTGDRLEFLGAAGSVHVPEALQRSDLGGHFTPGTDPCAAFQVHVDIAANSDVDVLFYLGEGDSLEHIGQVIVRARDTDYFETSLAELRAFWEQQTRAVRVHTPDAGFDLLVNHWLIYQTLSSRVMGRAGFYQAGGAFGFRDQLQDMLALLPSDPARVRQQIILAAQYQFEQGDVLHWWHPPGGRGVRTRISDDRLWLPWVTARYIETTADWSILDVDIHFLDAPVLRDEEHDRYAGFAQGHSATLYEHCCRALENGMNCGAHGLPLIGTGDWNDGMDRVGHEGRGESVWLAWFRISVVQSLIPLAEFQGEHERAERWRGHAHALKTAIDEHAWDGRWFIRAFDDQGNPWGSSANDECQIDAIAQAWGALAGFATEERVTTALRTAEEKLVDPTHRIVKLLDPPFHGTLRNPGYIKAYPPGIRENGGQYTHAAAWLGLAFANAGDGDAAYRIFDIINPIGRCVDRASVKKYAREPYVLAADVGGADDNLGRGGWTWYTGAAAWSWQLAVSGILGIHHVPGGVRVEPCLPGHWDHVEVMLDASRGTIALSIHQSDQIDESTPAATVDGEPFEGEVFLFPETLQIRRVVLHRLRSSETVQPEC